MRMPSYVFRSGWKVYFIGFLGSGDASDCEDEIRMTSDSKDSNDGGDGTRMEGVALT